MSTTNPNTSTAPPPYAGFCRFTVAEYQQMMHTGILTEGEPVELLEGYVVTKMPQNPPHASALARLANRLPRRLPDGWTQRNQSPFALPDSRPEPDVAVVRGDEATYDGRHPVPADFGIVVEVSDSGLPIDRGEKGRLYASAGIPMYWIVNVAEGRVEMYSDPDPAATPPAYRTRTDYPPGQDVPTVLDARPVAAIPAADLLP